MIKCEICGRKFSLIRSLSKHIKCAHKEFSIKKYFDIYLKKEGEGICQTCDKSTKFKNLTYGYNKFCSNKCIGKTRKNLKGIKKSYTTQINTDLNQLCTYGCGQVAKYILKNGKYCCSQNSSSCPGLIRKSSRSRTGVKRTPEMIKKLSDSHLGQKSVNKGKTYIEIYGEERAKQIQKQMRDAKRITLEDFQIRYPILYTVEELRIDPVTKKIQGHCNNNNCPNSKEQNGWFILTYSQIYERHRAVTWPDGTDGAFFYCSENCKQTCSLYGRTVEQLIKADKIRAGHIKELLYTSEEYDTYRNEVFRRADYKCEYCGDLATHVHHGRPQKLEPFFSLDPDWGIATCSKCHYKYGHPAGTECSTGRLANIQC